MRRIGKLVLGLVVLLTARIAPTACAAQSGDEPKSAVVIENFESYAPGAVPDRWKYVARGKRILSFEEVRDEGERFYTIEENGNQFARMYTRDGALRVTLRNGFEFNWNLEKRPRLTWRWRANQLPRGANEKYDRTNDAGAAVYVTFGEDWLGRPISIKYTYSSTLPVGTVIDYGPLMVMVVDSAREPGTGQWKTVTRNVIADYRQLFGEAPPDRPVSITIWSDTDTTHGVAEVDFDDFKLLPPRRTGG